jgi:hypothetical protein
LIYWSCESPSKVNSQKPTYTVFMTPSARLTRVSLTLCAVLVKRGKVEQTGGWRGLPGSRPRPPRHAQLHPHSDAPRCDSEVARGSRRGSRLRLDCSSGNRCGSVEPYVKSYHKLGIHAILPGLFSMVRHKRHFSAEPARLRRMRPSRSCQGRRRRLGGVASYVLCQDARHTNPPLPLIKAGEGSMP